MPEAPVLLVHGTDAWYGSDRALFTLACALRERGLAPTIVLARPEHEAPGPLSRRLERAALPLVRVPGSLFDRAALRSPLRFGLSSLRGARAVSRLARRLDAPVLANTSLVGHLVLPVRLFGLPSGVVFREIQLRPWGARFVSRQVYARLATVTVAVSRAVQEFNVPRRYLARSLVVLDEVVAAGGVSANGTRRNGDDGASVILVVGRLNPARSPHLALEAAERCVLAGRDLRLVFVGEADSAVHAAYVDDLRARAEREPLRGRVEFAGFVADPGPLLASAAVVLNPRPVEPLGHVVIEAFGAGRPVLAAAAGGPLELIESGVTGLLYRPGDAGSMARQLCWLLDHPAERERIGAAAKARLGALAAESATAHDALAARLGDFHGRGRRQS